MDPGTQSREGPSNSSTHLILSDHLAAAGELRLNSSEYNKVPAVLKFSMKDFITKLNL